jgi:hypothetical protein
VNDDREKKPDRIEERDWPGEPRETFPMPEPQPEVEELEPPETTKDDDK